MRELIQRITLLTVLAGFANQPVVAGIISTFDGDAEGWTLTAGGGTLTHLSTGGNPGGYITMRDDVNGALMAYAPAAFLGDLTAFNGGSLSVDLMQITTAAGDARGGFGYVTIEGVGGDSAALDVVAGVPPSTWKSYSTPLDATTWGVTQASWETILADVKEIRMEVDSYVQFGDTVGFDNFGISAVPEPTSPAALLGIGVTALLGYRWRQRLQKAA